MKERRQKKRKEILSIYQIQNPSLAIYIIS